MRRTVVASGSLWSVVRGGLGRLQGGAHDADGARSRTPPALRAATWAPSRPCQRGARRGRLCGCRSGGRRQHRAAPGCGGGRLGGGRGNRWTRPTRRRRVSPGSRSPRAREGPAPRHGEFPGCSRGGAMSTGARQHHGIAIRAMTPRASAHFECLNAHAARTAGNGPATPRTGAWPGGGQGGRRQGGGHKLFRVLPVAADPCRHASARGSGGERRPREVGLKPRHMPRAGRARCFLFL